MQNFSQNKQKWFIFYEQKLLLFNAREKIPEEPLFQSYHTRAFPLGEHNGELYYCAELASIPPLPATLTLVPLRRIFDELGMHWYQWVAKAACIINWDLNHQFCGRCGAPTFHKIGTYERNCTNCGLGFYPRISPSMIVLISKEDEILMARSPHFRPGSYGLIAGYVEAGESIEETVHREVFEEVGLKIKNLQYFDSQSWPFPDSLMFGFTAEHLSGDIIIDGKEIEAAGWYHYDHLPGYPTTKASIAYRLIEHFILTRKRKS